MQIGDLVELNLTGKVVFGMTTPDADLYGTGVFLGMARGSEHIATIYWLGGAGYREVPKKYFQKILDKSSEQDTLLT